MLVVLRGGEVLVEKRAPTGIWGGLWSLPEAAADAAPAEFLASEWGLVAHEARPLEHFEHAFTHFTLEVAPWRIELARGGKLAEGKSATWLALGAVKAAALPSPVKKLLASI